MTSTVERRPVGDRKTPARKRVPPRRKARPGLTEMLVPGATAAAWALGAGLVACALPVLLIWAADGRSGADSVEATRTAAQLWLLAHGASLAVPGGVVGLVPLGLTLLFVALLHRAGRHSARQVRVSDLHGARPVKVSDVGQALSLILAIAVPYALVAAFLTVVAATPAVHPDAGRAVIGAWLVALVGATSGVLREAALTGEADRLPPLARRLAMLAMPAVAATGVLLAAGFLLVVLSLLVHADRVGSLSGATGPGLVGGGGLMLLQLTLLPNAAMWGASWLAGPGFAVGVGTQVSPWATQLGQVPALPMLAALPAGRPPVELAVLSLLVCLAAGITAGVLLGRRSTTPSPRTAAVEGALVGPVAGLLMLLLALVSGGPLGSGRLAEVGPSGWQVALAVAVQLSVWSALTSCVLAFRRR